MSMTDEEVLALMSSNESSILDAEDDAALAAMNGQSVETVAPEAVAPEPVDAGLVPQGLEHALKGYPLMAAGMADLPNLLSSVGTYPGRKFLNALGVPEQYTDQVIIPSLSEQEFMQPVNKWMNTTPGITKDDTAANLAQTAVEWGGLGPVSAFRKGASALPDLSMAAGATLGDYVDGDGPWGELAGGLLGLLSAFKGKGASSEALKVLDNTMSGNSDEVINTVRTALAADEAGTLADLSRDPGLMNAEVTVRKGENIDQYDNIEIARQRQIAEEVRTPFGSADANTAKSAGQERIDQIYDDITKGVERQQNLAIAPLRAEQQAAAEANAIPQAAAVEAGLEQAVAQKRAADAINNTVEASKLAENARIAMQTDETLAQVGIRGSDTWKAAKDAADAADVKPKWEKFDAIESTPYAPYKAIVDDFIDSLPDAQRIEFKGAFENLTRPFRNKKITEMKPKQIQKFLEQMKVELGKPKVGGGAVRGAAHDDLQKLYTELRTQLGDDVPIFEEAMEAQAALNTRFDKGGVVDEAAGGAPEYFFKKAGESDEAGAISARIIKDAEIPGMPAVQGDRLRALARRHNDGLPDEKFLLEYESIMDTLPPELRNQAQAVVDTGRGLEAAGAAETAANKTAGAAVINTESAEAAARASVRNTAKETARLERAVKKAEAEAAETGEGLRKATEQSNLNKYVKDREGTILKLLKNPDDVSGLIELQQSMKNIGELDSFNANLGDVILRRLSVKGRAEGIPMAMGQGPVLNASAIPEFHKIAASLVEAGYDPKVMQGISDKLYKLSTTEMRANARKLLMNDSNFMQDLLASGTAAAALKFLPLNSLVLAGIIRRAVKKAFSAMGRGEKATIAAIDDFMLHPDKYLKAAEDAKNPAQLQQTITAELIAASQTAQAIQN